MPTLHFVALTGNSLIAHRRTIIVYMAPLLYKKTPLGKDQLM